MTYTNWTKFNPEAMSTDDYPLLKGVRQICKTDEEYYKTKILAYKITSGTLCKLISPYAQPDEGVLVGNGEVRYYVGVYTTEQDTSSFAGIRKSGPKKVEAEQIVMFLKMWTETESLVLAGREYWIVHDRHLEPVIDTTNLPNIWKKWIEKFLEASQQGKAIKPPRLVDAPR